MSDEALNQLRKICLALPEAVEAGGVGDPTFKVRDKIFAMRHPVDGRWSMWCKAPSGFQSAFVASGPEKYFVPPYVGHHGWVGVWLDIDVDWTLIADLVTDSYKMTAPKKLVKLL